jgi:hypothetical protein
MKAFRPGDYVAVKCDISPGPFPEEVLVTITTDRENISGFVQKANLVSRDKVNWYIKGKVLTVTESYLKVQLSGSFFTTTGIAAFNLNWAKDNISTTMIAA